jgi:hypothetical protein
MRRAPGERFSLVMSCEADVAGVVVVAADSEIPAVVLALLGVREDGATAETRVHVDARTEAAVDLVADGVVVALIGFVGEGTTLLGPDMDAVERIDDEANTATAEAPARSCGRGEVGFVGEEPDAVSFLFASARYAAHSRSQSSGSAMAKSRIAFMSSLSCVMASGGGGKKLWGILWNWRRDRLALNTTCKIPLLSSNRFELQA